MSSRRIAAFVIAITVSGCATPAPPSASVSPPAPASQPTPPQTPTVHTVSAADLGASWRPECPLGPADLRRIELNYTGFDGHTHRGALVVNQAVVEDVIAIFADLQRLGYPIQRMQTVEHYPGAEDELSMEDNNTSAFNCRPLPGSTAWSRHAYGMAVDINPLINPYLDAAGDLQPKTAARYLDRSRDDPGMLRADSPAVRAFTQRGWRWGGSWHNPVDYQHFETG